LSDEEGLNKAYDSVNGIHVEDGTMYLAGTRTHSPHSSNPLHEWLEDIKIPFGQTRTLDRYVDALAVLPNVDRVVGHSMGGSVALQLQNDYPHLVTTTYGAPVLSATAGDRHRDLLDPFSALDFGSSTDAVSTVHSTTLGRDRFAVVSHPAYYSNERWGSRPQHGGGYHGSY